MKGGVVGDDARKSRALRQKYNDAPLYGMTATIFLPNQIRNGAATIVVITIQETYCAVQTTPANDPGAQDNKENELGNLILYRWQFRPVFFLSSCRLAMNKFVTGGTNSFFSVLRMDR